VGASGYCSKRHSKGFGFLALPYRVKMWCVAGVGCVTSSGVVVIEFLPAVN